MQQRYLYGCPERLINIKEMAVTKALIAQPSGPQKLRAHVEADWDSNMAICKFSTLDVSQHSVYPSFVTHIPCSPDHLVIQRHPSTTGGSHVRSVATSLNSMPSAQLLSATVRSCSTLSNLTWPAPTANWPKPYGKVSPLTGPSVSLAT